MMVKLMETLQARLLRALKNTYGQQSQGFSADPADLLDVIQLDGSLLRLLNRAESAQ